MKQQQMVVAREEDKLPLIRYIQNLKLTDRPWLFIIQPWSRKRSTNQNNLYWKWMRFIGKEIGEADPERVSEAMKLKFLGAVTVRFPNNEEVEVPASSSSLSVKEMKEYMECIETWCATEFGLLLPTPENWID